MSEPRLVTVYIDYKSPYAYLAKDLAYNLEYEQAALLRWLPYVLDIPSFLGSARVDTDGHVIPGLHAAGELVGGLFYFNYPGGTGLMAGAVFGRIAGATAGRRAASNA